MVEAGIDDILWNADTKFEAASRYYHQVDADVLFYFNDIVIQAEAMGAKASYSKRSMPAISVPARLVSVPDPKTVPRMVVNAQVLKHMEKEFPDKLRAALIYGPFTVAGQLAGEETLLRMLLNDPEDLLNLLEKTYECARRYVAYLAEAGANLVFVSDPLASLIPPDQFREYSGDFLRRLFEPYHSVPTILHICGDTSQFIREMVRTGVGGISFDNCMDLMALEDQIPEHVYIIGNIDPVEVIELGSPDEVISRTSDLVSMMALKDNFVLSTGCAVPPYAPIENIKLFVQTGKRCLAEIRPHIPLLQEIDRNVYEGDGEATAQHVALALRAHINPLTIIVSGLTRAIRRASAMYEVKSCFLPQILLKVDAFYKGFMILKNQIEFNESQKATIVLGVVKGDIHEIGKNLVKIFLEINGYKVIDLGVDVGVDAFIEAYQNYHPFIIGLSAFTTISRKEMKNIINTFHLKGVRDSLFIVGGAAVNEEIARSIGANGYARDAIRAVSLIQKILKQRKK